MVWVVKVSGPPKNSQVRDSNFKWLEERAGEKWVSLLIEICFWIVISERLLHFYWNLWWPWVFEKHELLTKSHAQRFHSDREERWTKRLAFGVDWKTYLDLVKFFPFHCRILIGSAGSLKAYWTIWIGKGSGFISVPDVDISSWDRQPLKCLGRSDLVCVWTHDVGPSHQISHRTICRAAFLAAATCDWINDDDPWWRLCVPYTFVKSHLVVSPGSSPYWKRKKQLQGAWRPWHLEAHWKSWRRARLWSLGWEWKMSFHDLG